MPYVTRQHDTDRGVSFAEISRPFQVSTSANTVLGTCCMGDWRCSNPRRLHPRDPYVVLHFAAQFDEVQQAATALFAASVARAFAGFLFSTAHFAIHCSTVWPPRCAVSLHFCWQTELHSATEGSAQKSIENNAATSVTNSFMTKLLDQNDLTCPRVFGPRIT